ncbi:MAG: glycosyltransferase family 1 protein [Betaproteobacteria bacterium]|nr:glycosyltransferase family 1 protein [Betaproteobacteria bacterium]MBK9681917.1 glycosyltransferase family 1 protein [Betaproteobacteria bacterium]
MATPSGDTSSCGSDTPHPRRLRVAVVTETYPPEVNGVAATISRVVAGLRQRGHDPALVRPRQGPADRASAEGGAAEMLVRGLSIPRYPELRMGLPCRRALMRHWAMQRPDVVHLVTEGPLGWSALQAAARLGLPVVSDFRTNFHAYSSHYGVAWLRRPIMGYLRHFHNRTAATMVPTDALRGELAAGGFERLRVVSRGVDTALFDPARRSEALRASWGVAPHGPVVLYVGRLALEKNLGDLLAAFEAVRGVTPGACLVLVGDGPERASLQRRCPDAVFAGVRRGGDLAAHYASADLFLFPSLTETFGNVVPEAMASGLALVAYDCAAAAQLVRHAENGLIVRSGESRGFCAAAACLAANPPAARAMGVRARATARRLDWESIVQAIETEYLVAMAKGMARDRAAELWLRRRTLPSADCHQTATRRTQTQAGTVIDETEESAQLG